MKGWNKRDYIDVIAGVAIVFFILVAIFSNASAQNEPAQPFDHSKCQYPYRTTNPVNGCDNSDPCDPETLKEPLGGACKEPQQEVNATSQNIEEPYQYIEVTEGK
jgi:hypothetical protein